MAPNRPIWPGNSIVSDCGCIKKFGRTVKAKNRDEYHAWRSKNLHRLLKAGIPERIANENREFWFLVQEGEELGGGGWNVEWINDQEASELCKLLAEFFEDDLDWDLLDRLRRKLGYANPHG